MTDEQLLEAAAVYRNIERVLKNLQSQRLQTREVILGEMADAGRAGGPFGGRIRHVQDSLLPEREPDPGQQAPERSAAELVGRVLNREKNWTVEVS